MTNKYLVAVFWGSLFYVEYRWGLTLNRFFVVVFLITTVISTYYAFYLTGSALLGLKSSRLLSRPIRYYRRKLFIYVMIAAGAFYGFYRTQIPGQLERYQAYIEREFEEWTQNQETSSYRDDSYSLPISDMKQEKLVSDIALSASTFDERRVDSKEINQEIIMGWNTATADTENDNTNWEKATDLLKKYPNYILNASGHNVRATKALAEPWEYYGEIVSFKGQVYAVHQLPPEDSVAQFFDGTCYHAMLAVRDKKTPVIVSAYIIGNSADVPENSVINIKGFIYGQAALTNSAGGILNGLAFVGFRE